MFGGLIRDRVQVSGSVYEQRNLYLNETWLWQPNSWTSLSSSNPPSPRYGHAMVTDESTNEIILFGGRTADGLSGETWALSLNGLGSTANWRKLAPPTSPLPRFGHSMAYDPVRRKVVLTGGEGASAGQSFGDTWEWDSATQRWTARNIQPLEGRAGHVTFYDRARAQLIAFGGFAHRDNGQFALTYGDTLAFVRPTETDASGGLPNGSRCAAAGDCSSSNCIDGFCCNSPCGGQCGACDNSGFEGTCTAVKGLPHGARASCGADSSTCANQCDGADVNACHTPGVGTSCGPAVGCGANDTFVTSPGACNGTGACATSQVSCLPYNCCPNCTPAACRTDCASGSDLACGTGYKCNGSGSLPRGVCYKPTKILSFTASPAQPKVGVAVTLSVTATEAGSEFAYYWRIGNTLNTRATCAGATCSWTPTADQAGQQVIWTVQADAAPAVSRLDDDSSTLTLTVVP